MTPVPCGYRDSLQARASGSNHSGLVKQMIASRRDALRDALPRANAQIRLIRARIRGTATRDADVADVNDFLAKLNAPEKRRGNA